MKVKKYYPDPWIEQKKKAKGDGNHYTLLNYIHAIQKPS